MYRCDWCAKPLEEGAHAVYLHRHWLDNQEGLTEHYFDDGSHEMLFHSDCFLQNSGEGLILLDQVECGCSLCSHRFDGDYHSDIITLELLQLLRATDAQVYAYPRPFRDGAPKKDYCYECLAGRVDPVLLGCSGRMEAWR